MWLHIGARDKETTDEIDRQEDRAAAIIAAAYFEDRIALAIKSQLVADDIITDQLFKGRGQLADFGTKLDIAYLLGILTKRQHRAAHTIRTIRNEFAHNLSPLNFESQLIRDRCRQLYNANDIMELRNYFELMVQQNRGIQSIQTLMPMFDQWFTSVSISRLKPRDSYMNAIQVFLLLMSMKTAHGRMLVLPPPSRDTPEQGRPPETQTASRKKRTRERRSRSSQE